jgi:hypothetical protein
MYVARIPNRDSPPAVLLRESYREEGKVKSRSSRARSPTSPIGPRASATSNRATSTSAQKLSRASLPQLAAHQPPQYPFERS